MGGDHARRDAGPDRLPGGGFGFGYGSGAGIGDAPLSCARLRYSIKQPGPRPDPAGRVTDCCSIPACAYDFNGTR